MAGCRCGQRPRAVRPGRGRTFGGEGALVRPARRDGRARRPPTASGDDLDAIGVPRRRPRRAAELIAPGRVRPARRRELDSSHAVFNARSGTEPDVGAGEVPVHARHVRPPRSRAPVAAIGLERVLDGAARSAVAEMVSEVLEALDVSESMLPEVVAATEPISTITAAFAEFTGLDPSTLVAVGCRGRDGGHARAAGVFEPGEVCDVVGTAEPVCAASSRPREDPTMLVEWPSARRPRCLAAREPRVRLAATAVVAGPVRADRARRRGRGTGRCVRPPVEGGRTHPAWRRGSRPSCRVQGAMAPEWNGAARGVFYGLTLAHSRAHMTRRSSRGARHAPRHRRGDGQRRAERPQVTDRRRGAKGPIWRQIKADVTGLPVRADERRDDRDRAAILAAVGAGLHPTVGDAVKAFVEYELTSTNPTRSDARRTPVLPPVPRPLRGPQAGVRRVSSVRLTTR